MAFRKKSKDIDQERTGDGRFSFSRKGKPQKSLTPRPTQTAFRPTQGDVSAMSVTRRHSNGAPYIRENRVHGKLQDDEDTPALVKHYEDGSVLTVQHWSDGLPIDGADGEPHSRVFDRDGGVLFQMFASDKHERQDESTMQEA